jgi:hypothetical protein|tara:strand:+ start:5147 stop:6244 length:1098 start_codon:yes stop_codon:yes gene_type:complete
MANVEIKNPRFYCDLISSHIAKGVTQNGSFDVTATGGGFIGLQNGTEAELFDNKPLNQVDFDTSGDTDGHVLITIDLQASHRVNFVSILNHNMNSADAKVRIFAGNEASDITAADGANADTSDIDWSAVTITEVVNADSRTAMSDNKSGIVVPAADGSTMFTFTNTNLRYWGIQFEGKITEGSDTATDALFDGSTDLKIGCIQIGCFYDMPHSPDMTLARSVQYDQNKILKSIGGQKYGLSTAVGKYVSSTSKSPFLTTSTASDSFMGKISYDFAFSYIQDTDLLPAEYTDLTSLHTASTRTFIQDVWNVTLGNLLPFIFSVDNTSAGDDAESELIFARFDSDTLDMKQIAHKLYNIRLKITEEF